MTVDVLQRQLGEMHAQLDAIFHNRLLIDEEQMQLEATKQSYTHLFSNATRLVNKQFVLQQYEHAIARLRAMVSQGHLPDIKKINPVRLHGGTEQFVLDLVLVLKSLAWLSVALVSWTLVAAITPAPGAWLLFRIIAGVGLPAIMITAVIHAIDCLQQFSFFSPYLAATKEQQRMDADLNLASNLLHDKRSAYEGFIIFLESLFWATVITSTAAAGLGTIALCLFFDALPMAGLMMIGAVAALFAEGKQMKNCLSRISLFSAKPALPDSSSLDDGCNPVSTLAIAGI